MKQILSLTPEQEAKIAIYREEWFRIGTCTAPADRPRAEAVIAWLYEAIGEAPPRFVWADSPLSAPLFRYALLKTALPGKMFPRGVAEITTRRRALEVVGMSLYGSLEPLLGAPAGQLLRRSILASLGSSPRARLISSFSVSPTLGPLDRFWSQMDGPWIALARFCRDELGIRYDRKTDDELDQRADLARSCLWWFPYRGVCVVSERPSRFHLSDQRHLHNDAGPAVSFRDGRSVWAIDGVVVDEQVVLHPETQRVRQIRREPDAAVKRIRIERYGWERYLNALHARVVNHRRNNIEATSETLLRTPDGEAFFACACPSTARVHVLQVPPDVQNCEHAQYWLSGGLAWRIINAA